MKKKIYLYLCGGLGNQLFQYAAAKNLAIKNDADLVIDISTGFLVDYRDQRKFSLNLKKLQNVILKKITIFFLLYIIIKKFFRFKSLFNNFYFFNLVNEMKINFFDERISNFNMKKNLYLFGYFQSEKYFKENRDTIVKELMPSIPNNKIFIDMQEKIINTNSVLLGVRMYEDLSENILFNFGGLTPIDFYRNAIKVMINKVNNPVFFIFSTKKSNLIKLFSAIPELEKYKTFQITEDNNFRGASENLWLMSYCKHHIISNSSLYWWGAYFSSYRYDNQQIICSNNFINKDTCLDSWKLKE